MALLVTYILVSDATKDYSDIINEQVDMVEVETEPNESHELFSISKNTINIANHLMIDQTISKSENHSSIHFEISFQ